LTERQEKKVAGMMILRTFLYREQQKLSNPLLLNYSTVIHQYKDPAHLTKNFAAAPTGEFITYDSKLLWTGLHNPPCPHPRASV